MTTSASNLTRDRAVFTDDGARLRLTVYTADRAVFTDDGERLCLTVYTADPPALATAALEPLEAIRLARELLDGGLRHLWRERRQ